MPVSMSNLSDGKAQFLRDLIAGFLISAAFIFVADLVLLRHSGGIIFTLMWITFGTIRYVHFVVPGLLIVFGLFTVRVGYMVGPFLALFAASFAQQGLIKIQESQTQSDFETLKIQPLSKPTRNHKLVAIEERGYCSEICKSILATRKLTIATRKLGDTMRSGQRDSWILHEATQDDQCWRYRRKGSNISEIISFLKLGRADTCLKSRQAAKIDTALVLTAHSRTYPEDIPESFYGTVLEASELVSGERKRLGLWLDGEITNRSGLASVGRNQKFFKPTISKEEFISRFLELGSTSPKPQPADDPLVVLKSAERLFDQIPPNYNSPQQFAQIAVACCRKRPDIINTIFEQLLHSEDALRITAALKLKHYPPFYEIRNSLVVSDARLAELIRRATSEPDVHRMAEALYPQIRAMQTAFPSAMRDVVKSHLVTSNEPHPSQLRLIFMLLLKGGADERADAIDAIFSLEDTLFTKTVCAIGPVSGFWGDSEPEGWTQQELHRIVERAVTLPVSKPWRCLYRFGAEIKLGNHLTERLARKVEQKIAELERIKPNDQIETPKLKRILAKTPRIER